MICHSYHAALLTAHAPSAGAASLQSRQLQGCGTLHLRLSRSVHLSDWLRLSRSVHLSDWFLLGHVPARFGTDYLTAPWYELTSFSIGGLADSSNAMTTLTAVECECKILVRSLIFHAGEFLSLLVEMWYGSVITCDPGRKIAALLGQ